MPIADRRSPRNTKSAVTDHVAACFSQHTRSSTVGQVCRTALTTVERVIDFSIYDLGGLLLGQRSPKGEVTYYPPRSTILQNLISARSRKRSTRDALPKFFAFWPRGLTAESKLTKKGRWPFGLRDLPACKISSLYTNPRPRYPLPKFLRTNKQTNRKTVNDISPTCLS